MTSSSDVRRQPPIPEQQMAANTGPVQESGAASMYYSAMSRHMPRRGKHPSPPVSPLAHPESRARSASAPINGGGTPASDTTPVAGPAQGSAASMYYSAMSRHMPRRSAFAGHRPSIRNILRRIPGSEREHDDLSPFFHPPEAAAILTTYIHSLPPPCRSLGPTLPSATCSWPCLSTRPAKTPPRVRSASLGVRSSRS
ncbi:hypothetical protein F4821DRAFT_207612 [Hypoxylon rubiginosum]|uniref:Uncharacterized protein n=1 Tax=Hypoxylon rubiginosum TaxID=110542 RepID=A0ACC0CQA9_9PEZI|nr:hypothetical protein F4821DRAFT_207612 [Hypoxylon rubiginosum]